MHMNVDPAGIAQVLREQSAGEALLPGDPGYDDAVRGHNHSAKRAPSVVFRARDAAGIATAVGIAATHEAAVGVMSTGHSARTLPDVDLLVLTSELREITIDPQAGTATVGAGAVWSDIVAAAAPAGLAPLCGSHGSVGAVGYILGGGIGPLGRQFGFAADRVRSLEVVTSDGQLLTVDDEHHGDLFWALRGGRHGLGIVTSITFELVAAARIVGGSIFFDSENATEIFTEYANWTKAADDDVSSSLAVMRFPDMEMFGPILRGRTVVQLELAHTGDAAAAEAELLGLREWGEVLIDDVRQRPFAELVAEIPEGPGWTGAVALRELAPEAISTMLGIVGPEQHVPFIGMQVRHLGGAMCETQGAENAVGGRDAEYLVFLLGAPVPELIAGPIPQMGAALFTALSPWTLDGVAVNFADHLDISGRERAWPDEVRARLDAVREARDPEGMFRYADG